MATAKLALAVIAALLVVAMIVLHGKHYWRMIRSPLYREGRKIWLQKWWKSEASRTGKVPHKVPPFVRLDSRFLHVKHREKAMDEAIRVENGDYVTVLFPQPNPFGPGLIAVRWTFKVFAVGVNAEEFPDDDRLVVWPSNPGEATVGWPIIVNPDGSAISQGVPMKVANVIAGS